MVRRISRMSGTLGGLVALALGVPAMAGQTVSFQGSDSGIVKATPVPNSAYVITNDLSTSSTSNLGPYTVVAYDLVDFSHLAVLGGAATLTFAGGQLFVAYGGGPITPQGSALESVANGKIIGGTGQFAGATGAITFDSLGTVTGGYTETVTGTIFLPGRDH